MKCRVRPKSRKSGSGQSSILKAALRQPLQHVSSNVSLNQESPVTSKLKRRVSFAEKNHVKEFADSVEQGTLWNNSYEESSNQNTGQIDLNNQNHETRTNNNHSTSSDMIVSENRNLMNDSLELTECLVTMGSLKSIYTEETPLNKSISLAHQSKSNNEGNNILIESNHNINICGHKSINVHNNISSLNNMEGSDLNKTCIQDISMEVTEIPSFMKSNNILPVKCKQVLEEKENIPISNIIIKSNVPSNSTNEMNTISNKTQYFCTETLEFTECLQSTKEPLDLQQQFSKASALMNDENMINHQTQIFQNAPMEMTCAIPLTCRRNSTDQTVFFHDASMDDTMMVTSVMNKKQKLMNKNIPQIEDDNRFFRSMINSVNKTKLLDASMDITEGIYSLPHSTKVNDVTDTVTNTLNYQSSAINSETELKDDSMEFTVAATNLPQVIHNIDREKLPQVTKMNACTMSNQIRLSSENTKIFQNESMAITEPLHVLSSLNILQNDSQELKDVIMNFPRNNQDIMSPNTKIFQNMSMEITNAIANLPILPNLEKSSENIENNLNTNEKQIDVIEHGSSQENSMDFTTPVYSNPSSFTITSNKIVDTTIKNNNTFKYTNENNDIIENITTKHVNENRDYSLLQNKSNNPINEISNKNEKLEKHDCILDSIYEKTRKNHSMSETVQETNVQFNNSNSNINKSADQAADDTYISSTTYCNDDFENTENISTDNQPVKALTSLISSFVYADMIEDDSFVKTIHEVQQEIQSRENDMNSVVDIVNAQAMNTQSFEKCIIENKQIVKQSENYFKCYHEDNNTQVDDIMINKEVNNQHNSDIVSNKINEIHENIFENSINNERLIDTSTEVEVIGSDKQLHKAKKNVENNSATYIIKSKKNSDIDINEHINDHSSNNQVLCRSHVLSPTLIFTYNQNKTYIDENNIIPTADVADLTCSMNVTENYDNNSSREEVNHVVLEENIGKNNNFQEDKFSLIVKKLKIHMHSNDCIWDLYFENIDKQMIVVGFISTSLLIIIYTQNDIDTNTCMIKDINVISRLEDDENVLLSIAHKLIKEKINIEHISQLYKYEKDIIPLLNHISEDVKLILDFIFDLKQLEDMNLMEIDTECITFISRSKCMDIILKITMKVKLFDKINSSNIKVVCILGTVIENDIRELFTNVKKDHKFLRRYMSDIKDYIDIMEQVNDANKKCRY
ncbi:metacaspase-2-like isoform X1 [Vespa crabro]|uniref:metacaspase-2-like isoform X1 n=1 Tax=Vespa crabro TaxID=7445 RepID=UPI001EFFDA5D|nr:metacaspase-2-like isoform X1 [Vespa crabro]